MKQVFDSIVIGAGQSGLAAAYHLQKNDLEYLVLEASDQAAGSWPHYYDNLTLFSPARYSSLPEIHFPGDGNRYPTKNEVISYLTEYADHFQFPIQTGQKVINITSDNNIYQILTSSGEKFYAKTLISATGAFSRPFVPRITGNELFSGSVIHSSQYKNVNPYISQRIIVVGGANSAVQIAYELAQVADVSLATRKPISFVPQQLLGKDIHFWFKVSGIDRFSFAKSLATGTSVLDTGMYKDAISKNKPDRKPMFIAFTEEGVVWTNGQKEKVDHVIFATGYQPNTDHFYALKSALDTAGKPIHKNGISQTVHGLYYVGLNGQRNFASATIRGVGTDANYVVKHIQSYIKR